jgi:hypothetical protein
MVINHNFKIMMYPYNLFRLISLFHLSITLFMFFIMEYINNVVHFLIDYTPESVVWSNKHSVIVGCFFT